MGTGNKLKSAGLTGKQARAVEKILEESCLQAQREGERRAWLRIRKSPLGFILDFFIPPPTEINLTPASENLFLPSCRPGFSWKDGVRKKDISYSQMFFAATEGYTYLVMTLFLVGLWLFLLLAVPEGKNGFFDYFFAYAIVTMAYLYAIVSFLDDDGGGLLFYLAYPFGLLLCCLILALEYGSRLIVSACHATKNQLRLSRPRATMNS